MNFGIIGVGRMGFRHATNIFNSKDHNLVAICDPNIANANKVNKLTKAKICREAELLNLQEVEAVLIVSPAALHYKHIQSCIKAKKPFICEKPLASNLIDAKKIVYLAKKNKSYGMLSLNRRFDEQFIQLRNELSKGTVGKLEMMRLTSRSDTPPTLAYAKESGGMLRDKGAHWFDLACWIANELPVSVFANGQRLFYPELKKVNDYDTMMIILEMKSGALCQFDFSRRAAYGNDERIEIFGSKGMLSCTIPPNNTITLTQSNGLSISAGAHGPWKEHYAPTYLKAIDAFATAYKKKQPVPISLEVGIVNDLIATAANKSIQSGKKEKINV